MEVNIFGSQEKPSAVKTKQAENESLKKASAVLDGDGNHGTGNGALKTIPLNKYNGFPF